MEEVFADPSIGAIIAYHPVIFKPLRKLTMEDAKDETLLKCIAEGISIYCPHTALDACNPGSNSCTFLLFLMLYIRGMTKY